MPFNITSIKTSSNGVWQGDNPLDYAFPLLIVQITLILIVSRSLAFILKPIREPKVIAEIIGGILLGPSALGRNISYMHRIFPSWSMPIFESVASIGLLFCLFLVGLELDLKSICRSGRSALSIAAAGISLPFICGIGVTFVLRKTVDGADKVGYGQLFVFMGVAFSITAFPVLARILAELNLLTTRLGETAMAAAAFNDATAWILLALAIALAGDGDGGHHKSPLVSVWVLLSGLAFVIFMIVVIRPAMKWVASRCCPERDTVDEFYIGLTLAGVMVSGFMTDLIGIHSIFGAFVFGLTIPKGDHFADRLIERIEDFVSGLLLPLYFASSGLKTNITKIRGAEAWGLLVLVISTACAGKILGTFAVAVVCMMPAREALTLGVLMNTKGLVELIVLNIGKQKKVLNDEMFAILVLMALFTTFVTSPTVMALYKPARGISGRFHRKLGDLSPNISHELRLLACVHGTGNLPSIIGFIESTRGTKKPFLKVFVMKLVELTERTSSILMVQRAHKKFNCFRQGPWCDRLAGAFQAYSQLGRVTVRPTTATSSLFTMHECICHAAEEKRVAMIILPFHIHWRDIGGVGNGTHELPENVGNGWRGVNQKVLKNAPCSVAVLVDRGFGNGSQTLGPNATVAQRICVVFFGGPDDREAIKLGGRMAEHPAVKVTVVKFVDRDGLESNGVMLRPSPRKSSEEYYSFSTAKMDRKKEKELDETAVAEFKSKREGMVEYEEKLASNVVEGVLAIGRSGDYDLLVVGKGRFPSAMVAELAEQKAEHAELGPIGDVLASSGKGVVSSVLVVQQHDVEFVEESPASKVHNGYDNFTADKSWSANGRTGSTSNSNIV